MTIYFTILLLIILQGLILLRPNNKKSRGWFFFLVWLEITCMAGFRSVNVGRDTAHYFSMFNYVSHMPDLVYLSTHMERGFLLFSKFLSCVYDSPQFLFFVVGGIYNYVFLRFINKFSPWPFISILLFFSAVPLGSYVFGMTFLRQALAISCFLLGLEKLAMNHKIAFVLWICVGILFHKSVVFCFILLPLQKQRINFLTLLITVMGAIVIIGLLPILLPHLPFGIGNYAGYVSWKIGEISYFSAFVKAMAQFCVCMTLIYVYLSQQNTSSTTRLFIWLAVLAFICEVSAVRVLFMNRLLYFTVCNCIFIPYALACIKRKKELVLFSSIFILIFVFNNVEFWMRRAPREHLDQYEFYWENPRGITRWNLYG